MKVAVIIPAAGASKRFGRKGKKVFERVKDRPVFIRSIELFVNRDDVCQVRLVVAEEDLETFKTRYAANLGFMGVNLVTGGRERTDSVRNALEGVAEEADFICIHDAVRPCVSELWIDEVFAAAERPGQRRRRDERPRGPLGGPDAAGLRQGHPAAGVRRRQRLGHRRRGAGRGDRPAGDRGAGRPAEHKDNDQVGPEAGGGGGGLAAPPQAQGPRRAVR